MKKLSIVFGILVVLLSHVMCAVVAYDYAYLKYSNHLHSAPAWVALFEAIPFLIAITVCAVIAAILKKKTKSLSC